MAEFALPDMVLREDQMTEMLPVLAQFAGCETVPTPDLSAVEPMFFELSDIYDAEVEVAVQEAYQRDYVMFGFDSWD